MHGRGQPDDGPIITGSAKVPEQLGVVLRERMVFILEPQVQSAMGGVMTGDLVGNATLARVLVAGLAATLVFGACGGAGAPVAASAAPTTAAPSPARTTAAAASPSASTAATVTVKGTISKVEDGGKTVTVKTTDGKEIVFEISSSRTTLKDERPGSPVKARGDIKVGLLVTVEGPAAGEAKTFTITG